jgi:hypothetical protein
MLAQGMVMSDMPIQHQQPKHERRALLIAQLLEQAISAANADLSGSAKYNQGRHYKARSVAKG